MTDQVIRRSVFAWLSEWRADHGEAIPRSVLTAFVLGGRRVPLMGPQGIWTPAVCDLPISIGTTIGSPYRDAFDADAGTLLYSYRRSGGPEQRDNRLLRQVMAERVPIVYFHPIEEGIYAAAYPVFIVGDRRDEQMFVVQVDDMVATLSTSPEDYVDASVRARRAYVTRTVRQRLHQVAFRSQVIRAYRERCALCSLRHIELLDAAHITPDREEDSDPVVSNGVALCKLHHAAFDQFFFAIRPDYTVEVKPSILRESDGPMLVVGLQQIHDRAILLPSRSVHLPDRDRLARRYEAFRKAS